jgi:hypothetical protein
MGRVEFRSRPRIWIAVVAILLVGVPTAGAQVAGRYNEHEAKPRPNIQDKEGIWVLDFRFTAPRMITVDIPGRGRRVCWYLLYRVINNTKEPHVFIPDFELVTLDKPHVSNDQVLPKVQKAISDIEDPTKRLDIKNSVTIANQPIPPSKPNAAPKEVTGVAIWDDVSPEATHYSIFVSGLSNGWSVDDKDVVRRKTLKLNFRRLGDKYYQDSRDVRFVPPEEWIYRASTLKAPDATAAPPAKPKASEAPAAPAPNKTTPPR